MFHRSSIRASTARAALGAAALSVLLTGCFSADPEPTEPTNEPTETVDPTPTVEPKVSPTIVNERGLERVTDETLITAITRQNWTAIGDSLGYLEREFKDPRYGNKIENATDTLRLRLENPETKIKYEVKKVEGKKVFEVAASHPSSPSETVWYRYKTEGQGTYWTWAKVSSETVSPTLITAVDLVVGAALETAGYASDGQFPTIKVENNVVKMQGNISETPKEIVLPTGIVMDKCGGSLSSYECVFTDTYSKDTVTVKGSDKTQNRAFRGRVEIRRR